MEKQKYTYRSFRSKTQRNDGSVIWDVAGSITACCELDTEQRQVKVGFSFLNPTDSQLLVRGRGLAKQKLLRAPIVLNNIKVTEDGKFKITEKVLEHLKAQSKADMKSLTTTLGIHPYNGRPEKCEFLKWFPRLVQDL